MTNRNRFEALIEDKQVYKARNKIVRPATFDTQPASTRHDDSTTAIWLQSPIKCDAHGCSKICRNSSMRDCDPECTHYIQAHNRLCRTSSTVASVISADEFPVLSTTGFHCCQPTSTLTDLHQAERCDLALRHAGNNSQKNDTDGSVARASFLTVDEVFSCGMRSGVVRQFLQLERFQRSARRFPR